MLTWENLSRRTVSSLRVGHPSAGADNAEKARWKSLIENHKRYTLHLSLFEMMLDLLEISLASGVPTSLRNIPE